MPETRAGAEEAERRAITRVLKTGEPSKALPITKEVSTVREFHEVFLEAARINDKPSSIESKKILLRVHIVPQLGDLPLDQVTHAAIEDFKIALSKTPINTDKSYVGVKIEARSARLYPRRRSTTA